jgi:hypothetical protein
MLEAILDDVMRPAHFFVGPGLELEWEKLSAQEVPWELFRGQLLPLNQTRATAVFDTWNVYRVEDGRRSDEPLLSLKLDRAAQVVYVTRAIHCYTWEGYHAGDNVYLSRETQRWVNELVGSVDLKRANDESLFVELVELLFQAVVGVSRLPLNSVEAPLPDFSLGKLGYFFRSGVPADSEPIRSREVLLAHGRGFRNWKTRRTRVLELAIRTTPNDRLADLAETVARYWHCLAGTPVEFVNLLRGVFDEVALSPHTGFAERAIGLLPLLAERGLLTEEAVIDFLSYLLRHLARHLTAYDLITFHHKGANYPDALLLDLALKLYLGAIEKEPGRFLSFDGDPATMDTPKRIRRRALRQAWLLRRFYEGLHVPDAPTSPGENNRVLPPPHVRVPEDQFDPEKRRRRLYDGDPLVLGTHGRLALQFALRELELPSELRELGTALFLDRPLGAAKAPAEPDHTMLFSLEAFSRRIAGKRLDLLLETAGDLIGKAGDILGADHVAEWRRQLHALDVKGVDLPLSRGGTWPGKVSLDDVRRASVDFIFTCTTRRSVAEFLAQFDFAPLRDVCSALDYLPFGRHVLILRGDVDGTLAIYDAEYRKRILLQVDGSQGYETRGGCEYSAAGLRVLEVWNEAGEKVNVPAMSIMPR